jgi:hypothetical protein
MNFALYYARITTENFKRRRNYSRTTDCTSYTYRISYIAYVSDRDSEEIRRARVQLSRTVSFSPFDL